jgi:hypothetical protein
VAEALILIWSMSSLLITVSSNCRPNGRRQASRLRAPLLSSARGGGEEAPMAAKGYFAATGTASAYISGSTVWRQVSRRGKIFSIARAV